MLQVHLLAQRVGPGARDKLMRALSGDAEPAPDLAQCQALLLPPERLLASLALGFAAGDYDAGGDWGTCHAAHGADLTASCQMVPKRQRPSKSRANRDRRVQKSPRN